MKNDSVLRHAITAPNFGRTKLHRERLVDRIHANVPRKLIAIASPPGYGKTLLLADFTENTELPVCWVRLSDADRDVMRLANLIAASLQKKFRRLRGEPNLESLANASPEALARAFTTVIDEKVNETFILILDDVHHINHAKPVLEFLDAWLEEQPEQMTLIAAGREVLEVSLAKLMADGALAGMGPHDLALTRDELIELVDKQTGIGLEESDAETLLEETRGWITGVLLSGMLSRNVMTALSHTTGPMVYEYLASVVLNRQPDDVRRFMLDSAVLPIMTAESCDFLLQTNTSEEFLERLVREGYFVSASGEQKRMYEYHPQFREFLLEVHRDIDAENLSDLRLRAAEYYAAQEAAEYSVDLYFEAGALEDAAKLAEQHAPDLFRSGRVQTLIDWSEKLTAEDIPVPRLYLMLSEGHMDRGDLPSAQQALDSARGMLGSKSPKALKSEIECVQGLIAYNAGDLDLISKASNKVAKILPKSANRRLKALSFRIQAIAAAHHDHNFTKAVSTGTKAVELLDNTEYQYDLAMTLIDVSYYRAAMGDSLKAHATSTKAHKILEALGAPLPLATSFNNLAIDAHQQGRFEDALKLFNEAAKHARQAASEQREALVVLGQADLFNDLQLPLQAAELYGEGLRIASQIDNVGLIRYGCIQTSVLHRRNGSGDLPHQWLKRAMALDEGEVGHPDLQIQMAALEIGPASDRAEQSLREMISTSALEAPQHTIALYFLARSLFAQDRREEAMKEISTLLTWAGGHGTEQYVAAELMADEEFRDFSRGQMLSSPVMTTIFHRLDTMRAIAQQYQEIGEESPSISPRLVITTLGGFSMQRGADQLSNLKPLAREVLVYLADNQRVDRDVLVETFWPDFPPGRQVSNLYTAIYSLRRALGKDAITLEGSVYGIDPELQIEYDVDRFERASAIAEGLPSGDPRRFFALTESINSYAGPFLPEVTTEWALERRRGLELRFLEMLRAHADEALVRNQPLRALGSLRRALSIDPWSDDINIRYLETLGLLERRSEIVAHYQQYVQLLSNELGLDPPESVRVLYSRLIS